MIFDLKEAPMLLELVDKRNEYGIENHEVRVYRTPEEQNIMVVRLHLLGQSTYYCTSMGKTLSIDGQCYWGQGLNWDQALKVVELSTQKM